MVVTGKLWIFEIRQKGSPHKQLHYDDDRGTMVLVHLR